MSGTATIYALASAPGRAGIAVIRVSGDGAASVLQLLLGSQRFPEPRRAALRRIEDRAGATIDRGVVLWFPGPGSYTGEDLFELQLHGGRAVVADTLEALSQLADCRLAEPGEFSRRAFANNRLDLTQVEAVADLIDAETTAQRRQALRQLDGALGALYERWRLGVLTALAHVEASIDFIEEDLPEDLWLRQRGLVSGLRAEIGEHLADGRRGERLRSGVSVAIVGPPNAGKSSLLNALARRDVAIVAETAGTTRDVIEVHLDLAGYPVIVADTAGLRDAAEAVEREGVRRALLRAEQADLRLVVVDGTEHGAATAMAHLLGPDSILVRNKSDLGGSGEGSGFAVSAATGDGMAELLERLATEVAARAGSGESLLLTTARHREALESCASFLDEALQDEPALEERAEALRLAARALGRITGRVDVEDMLDLIFADFCIGK